MITSMYISLEIISYKCAFPMQKIDTKLMAQKCFIYLLPFSCNLRSNVEKNARGGNLHKIKNKIFISKLLKNGKE